MRSTSRRLHSPGLAISLLALFVALGGSGYAAVKINGADIRNGTVTGKKLKNRTLGIKKLSEAAVDSLKGQQGAKGDKGDIGPPGNTGAPGATGATGQPGSSAASVITGATAFALANGNTFLSPSGVSTLETLGVRQPSPNTTIVARDLVFQLATAPGSSGSRQLTLFANEAATPLSCSISGSATSCDSESRTATVPPGSRLAMLVASNDASPGRASWAFRALTP
jgi:hypothetical protein